MKKNSKFLMLILIFVAVLLLAFFGYRKLSDRYKAGEALPQNQDTQSSEQAADFTVLNTDGEEVNLSDFFGKPIVVNFWATWCGPCKSEMPAFDALYSEYGDDVEFLMVNLTDGSRDTVESAKSFITELGYTFPVYFDTELNAAKAYSLYSIPMTVFIGADGELIKTYTGSMNENTLQNYISELLGGV